MASKKIKFPAKIVRHYINGLNRQISIDGALLFGSFAYGRPTKHSDVDLIVISPDFKKKKYSNRLQWLSHMRDDKTFDIAMDVIGYTPKEFAEAENYSAILAKAKRKGKWLIPLKK